MSDQSSCKKQKRESESSSCVATHSSQQNRLSAPTTGLSNSISESISPVKPASNHADSKSVERNLESKLDRSELAEIIDEGSTYEDLVQNMVYLDASDNGINELKDHEVALIFKDIIMEFFVAGAFIFGLSS